MRAKRPIGDVDHCGFTVLVTCSGLPLICTVCLLLRIAAKTTVDRDRDHHHHTVVAFASGDITLMSIHPSPRVNSCCRFLSLSSPHSRNKSGVYSGPFTAEAPFLSKNHAPMIQPLQPGSLTTRSACASFVAARVSHASTCLICAGASLPRTWPWAHSSRAGS